ncbi:MAG: exodeoxyribonuclease III [bacterium]|nr:exodeoxyribonuclease III [bacterium]
MKIISWNVNGIRAIAKKGLGETIASLQPDIICLQEVKANASQLNDVLTETLPAYETILLAEASKPGYSGVATLAKKGLTAPSSSSTDIGLPEFENEGRFNVLKFSNFLLYNVYLPSGTTSEERQNKKYLCLELFLEHLKSLSQAEQKKLIICGDFNICHKAIDIHHPETAEKRKLSGFLPEERAWMDEIVSFGLTDSFRKLHPKTKDTYSWWTYRAGAREKNLGWRIDYFFIGAMVLPHLKKAEIHSSYPGSDHCPISITLKKE